MPSGTYKHIGRKHKPEALKKISEALKSQWKSGKRKSPMLGKSHSEETKRKMSLSRKGEKCYCWKGGISTENDKLRHNFEMRLWRKAVFERDNFTCQKYQTRGGYLTAHHINNFSEFPELRTAIDNGITLSKKAHKEFHTKYGIKNNTREQLEEFLWQK